MLFLLSEGGADMDSSYDGKKINYRNQTGRELSVLCDHLVR